MFFCQLFPPSVVLYTTAPFTFSNCVPKEEITHPFAGLLKQRLSAGSVRDTMLSFTLNVTTDQCSPASIVCSKRAPLLTDIHPSVELTNWTFPSDRSLFEPGSSEFISTVHKLLSVVL